MATLLRCAARFASFTESRTVNFVRHETPLIVNTSRAFSCTVRNLSERKYTEQHEWVKMDGNVGTVGISQHAQEALGDIVFVDLPEEGRTYEKDEECGAVESVKAASEIFCPVSGKIVETNGALADKPGLINTSCYDKGWMFKVELSNTVEFDAMLTEEKYQEYLKSQAD